MTYGHMTHSWLNSTEHRSTKKERAEATKEYEEKRAAAGDKWPVIEMLPACTCVYASFAHVTHDLLPPYYSPRFWRQIVK
jgi:hypothetical protein